MDFKKELNEEQYMAATHKDGPLLILAGAGSGKTRVLIYRIAYLVEECGVAPASILAITFTNKAAKEMLHRAEKMLNGDLHGMWISTFHSACGRILRACGEETGYGNNFTIYDDGESSTVIKNCLKTLEIDEKQLPVKLARSIISDCKNKMISPEEYARTGNGKSFIVKNAARVYSLYNDELRTNRAMDFDDMLLETVKLFETHPDILEHYSKKFRYIMVDEYQDTNEVQEKLITMLAGNDDNLCVVGDDDQSIYSFRGATIDNILGFEKKHKGCLVIKLEQNYRSTQNILDAANAVINKNESRKEKRLWTTKGSGDHIRRYEAPTYNDEAYYIAREIKAAVERAEFSYRDIAILYRINAISQSIESALTRLGIPYRVFGGMKYFDRKEVKDIMAYMRICTNLMDTVAIKRVINVPARGIGATSVARAEEIAKRENLPLFTVLLGAEDYPELSRAGAKMKEFATSILNFMVKMDELSVSDAVRFIIENSGVRKEYEEERTPEAQSRIENIDEFISVAKEYEKDRQELGESISFVDFLATIALSTDMDNAPDDNCISLMTMHSAKGLEFPCVFVVAMEEGVFPSPQGIDDQRELDEERRLCYVAITRAKKKLYITNSLERMLYGQTRRMMVSRFVGDIPETLFTGHDAEKRFIGKTNPISVAGKNVVGGYGFKKSPAEMSTFARQINSVADLKKQSAPIDLSEGMRVVHPKFGKGTVAKIEGEGDDRKVEIAFDEGGMKRFMVKFANLRKEV